MPMQIRHSSALSPELLTRITHFTTQEQNENSRNSVLNGVVCPRAQDIRQSGTYSPEAQVCQGVDS